MAAQKILLLFTCVYHKKQFIFYASCTVFVLLLGLAGCTGDRIFGRDDNKTTDTPKQVLTMRPDTTTCLSPAEQKLSAHQQKKAADYTRFLRQIKQLFELLQQNDIQAALPYASDYGLGTFLYLDIEKIDSFSIKYIRINNNSAEARLMLNDLNNPATCHFSRKDDTIWVFTGIEAAGMRRAVLLK